MRTEEEVRTRLNANVDAQTLAGAGVKDEYARKMYLGVLKKLEGELRWVLNDKDGAPGKCRQCGKELQDAQMVVCSDCFKPKGRRITAPRQDKGGE